MAMIMNGDRKGI